MSQRGGEVVWQFNPDARLRRTPTGGAVFLPESVTTVELDREAFTTLSWLTEPSNVRDLRRRLTATFHRNFTLAEIDILLCNLAAQKVVVASLPAQASSPMPSSAQPIPHSCAPESVHLQLNNVCNLRCPSCYVALCQEDAGALPFERICALLDEFTEMGVFQLALGGGEVLMSARFVPVVRAARERGLVPNATTNGWLITEGLLEQVQGSLGELRISLNDGENANLPLLESKAELLRAYGMRFGFNLIVTHCNLEHLAEKVSWVCGLGATTLNLIRPKPAPGNRQWYCKNALRGSDSRRLAQILSKLEPQFAQTTLSVDCALSFLFHGRPARDLLAQGVAGCALGDRFAAIAWNGDVYPCSHLNGEQFKAGNVTTASFRDIWEGGEVFTRVRRELSRVTGSCGRCSHNPFCRGCRAVVWHQTHNWLRADAGCPVG